jgi:hypothetical protein
LPPRERESAANKEQEREIGNSICMKGKVN